MRLAKDYLSYLVSFSSQQKENLCSKQQSILINLQQKRFLVSCKARKHVDKSDSMVQISDSHVAHSAATDCTELLNPNASIQS